MKLKELAIDGLDAYPNLHLGRLNDGLTIVYGENGGGKTRLRDFVQKTLFGIQPSFGSNLNLADGRLTLHDGNREVQFSRDKVDVAAPLGTVPQLKVHPLSSTFGTEYYDSVEQIMGSMNRGVYGTIFNFSLRDTAANASELAHVLQNQLGIPSGPSAAGSQMEYANWQRESATRRERLDSLHARIDAIHVEKSNYVAQLESERLNRQSRIADLDHQISLTIARINEIQTNTVLDQLAQTEREIAQLRLLIDNAQTRVQPAYVTPDIDRFSSLYRHLDEIDNQIRRWRHVQSDIQNQRVRLRDEMLVWNELTLDSDEHPYHTSRAILVALESKVDEAERNANHWSDAGGSRVDTTQMAKSLGQLCQSMREDLYGLCNELAQQYKSIRHKAAAAELKQLRRCYTEMGKNIDRLVRRRESIIRDIREFDPAGADAIVRAELSFCQCAQHEGYLEARRRLIGPVPIQVAEPVVHQPDFHAEHARLAALEHKRSDLKATHARFDAEHRDLENRLSSLKLQRDSLLNEVASNDLNLKIRALDSELDSLIKDSTRLRQQIELDRDYVPTPPNPILELACSLLARITSGELTQVFLGDSYLNADRDSQIDLQVRDQYGKVLNLSALDGYRQDQVYVCLAMAAQEHLKRKGTEFPMIIDDAFWRIPSDQATATLTVLFDFAATGNQIIAMTQHRYLADRIPGLPVFELPPKLPTISPATNPERRPVSEPMMPPMRESDWGTDAYHFPQRDETSAESRPYPLSKYPHVEFYKANESGTPVSYPFPQPNPTPVAKTSTVSVGAFGDRLGYASAITEDLSLEKIGMFDPQQLRSFAAYDIATVGELLAVDVNSMDRSGFNPDQFERWQSQMFLLINVPGMRISDARVLVACGITSPEQLETSHPQQLLERVNRFLASTEGKRFFSENDDVSLDRINGWYRSLDATRSRRQNQRPRSSRTSSPRSDRTPRPTREPRAARTPRMTTPTPERKSVPRLAPASSPVKSKNRSSRKSSAAKTSKTAPATGADKLKFYLDLKDHIESAPSIGPKTAERFEKIGVVSVADFLKQTAESMALKIKYKRISADVIQQWQQQARLVCRVPNLRGHDAQLLVACGVTEPEELATMQPQGLFDIVGPFSETKDGLKIIRSGKKPDLAEITDWISWAENTRSLQAA